MKEICHRGSYTIEASLLIPLIMLIAITTLEIAIDFYRDSEEGKYACEEEMDIVQMFYGYQIFEELGEEITGD